MLQNEKLFPIPTAVELATGQRPHPSTCHRWRLRGINGVKLETIRQGGRRFTSIEAVHRFNDAVTSATDGKQVKSATAHQLTLAIERAERELAKQGM